VIVTRSIDAERFVGTTLPPESFAQLHGPPSVATDIDGVERINAHSAIAGTPWIVTSGMPTSLAYGASDRLMTVVLILCSALLGLSLLAAILTGRSIARPVRALARRASDIAAGRGHAGTPLLGPREVVLAGQQLDEMVDALQASEQQLSHVLDTAGMGAFAIDLASGKVWRSVQHDRIFGHRTLLPEWSVEVALAQVVPDDRALFQSRFAEALETDRLGLECRIAWADASEHWIRLEGRVERDELGEPSRVIGTVADVTERVRNDGHLKQLEQELRQSQKMEAIGQLAGGIAHDFNNLLTAISGYSELALARLDGSDPELGANITEIARAATRAAELTRQLLAFSRRQILQTSVFDLNDAVSDSEALLRRLLGEHIEILGSQTSEVCLVDADRGQIAQILMNLALNARDAMPDGGTLAIETETVDADEGEAGRQSLSSPGRYVLLRVSDTGCGMDADTRARAFEPFFTTKPLGEGTGLGLATVFGSVRQNEGFITLTSEPGIGTTFEIRLPLVAAPVGAPVVPSAPARVLGTERILLVEDEEIVRELVREILVGEGYDVLVATNGEEALRISSTRPFDLLVTDIVMPKMSGKELAARLRRSRPDLRIVCMSGYAYDAVGGDGLTPGDGFIQKPFSARELATTVRATLDSVPTPLLTPVVD
jgi:signal transduction histidine kinase